MDLQEIQDQLDLNTSIQEDIKNMVKEVYSDIYSFLGERQFKKWLIDSHIKSIARRTIYRSLTEKEDKYLKENKTVAGYRTTTVGEKRDIIVLRKKVGDNKQTTAHETFHAFVDGWGGFNNFFGEGLTEFLSKNLYNSKNYSYKENVDVVSLVYSMYSDKLIKYFLTQKGDRFFFDIAKDVNDDFLNLLHTRNIEMEEHFKKYHEMIYDEKGINKKEANANLEEGINLLIANYYVYTRERIKDLEYIKNGKVDINKFVEEISKVTGSYINLGKSSWQFRQLTEMLTQELVENSHLLEGTGERREQIKQDICKEINTAIEVKSRKYALGLNAKDVRYISQFEEPYITLNTNQEEKLINKFIINNPEELNFVNKVRIIGKIQKAVNLSPEIVAKVLEKECKGKCSEKLLTDIVGKYSKAITNINAIEEKNNINFETPRYVQVELNCIPKKRAYFASSEQGQLSMLIVDNESGEVDNVKLNRFGEFLPEKGIFIKQCNNNSEDIEQGVPQEIKYYQNVFEIYSTETQRATFIAFNNTLNPLQIADGESIKIVNGKIDRRVKFLENIKEEILSKIIFENVEERIEKEQYSSIDKDKKINRMFYDDFIEEYNSIRENFPGIDKNEEELGYLSGKLIDRTFKIEDVPYTDYNGINSTVKLEYDVEREEIKRAFKELARAKRVGENTDHTLYLREKINEEVFYINSILNTAREHTDIFVNEQDKTSREQFLQSAINITKKDTRTSTIQSQIEQMQLLAKNTQEKNIETEKRDR